MIGIGQIAVVWYGIRAMQRMGAARAREQDQRHEETMAALNELVRDGQRQAAALDESIRASRRQTAALDELLRRSAPAE